MKILLAVSTTGISVVSALCYNSEISIGWVVKKSFFLSLSLLALLNEGDAQFAKDGYMISVNYSRYTVYEDVSDSHFELRAGKFFFKNFAAGISGSYQYRPYKMYGNTMLGLKGGYDGYTCGLYDQKYFHIYKSFYASLTMDVLYGHNTITPTYGAISPDSWYFLVNTRASFVYRPLSYLSIELSHGWANYSYLYLPKAPLQQSYFRFDYGVNPEYYTRWFVGVSYYLAR